jgi:poly(A) polymerase
LEKSVPIDQALMCDRPAEELELVLATGVLALVYPELVAMVGFGGHGQGHKDLWWHTKLVVAQTEPVRVVRWAALFHDVGKVGTMSRSGGKVSFHGHEIASARLFDRAARRTGVPDELRLGARALIQHLGHVEAYVPGWTDSAVRRLHRDTGACFEPLLMLASADITTRHEHKRRAHRERMAALGERARALAARDALLPLLPTGLGTAIIERLGLCPGPEIGRLMRLLEQAVADGILPARAEFEVYLAHLEASRQAPEQP